MTPKPSSPVLYSSALEHVEADEAQVHADLVAQLEKIQDTTYANSGQVFRSVHAKSHGLLVGRLEVHADLAPAFAQGLFAKAGTYDAVLRLSTPPGDVLDDSVSLPRGLAVKIMGVEGERVQASEGDATQDFVMVNGPAFNKPDASSFLKTLKILAATTDKGEVLKKALSATLRGVEKVVEAVGGKSPTLVSMGGHPETHILGETFFTQVPLRYGDHVAKVSFAPSSSSLKALTDAPLNVNGHPDGLRDAVIDFFRTNGGTWDVRVQLLTNPDSMPVEDASVVWPEDESPYVTVATLRVDPQSAWDAGRVRAIDEGLAFNPWHALAAHQPLGGIMRARRVVYETMSRLRRERSGVTATEPRSIDALGPLA
jgi:hypothetical protein